MADFVRVDAGELAGTVFRMVDEAQASFMHTMQAASEALVAGVADVYEAEGPGWPDLAESTKMARRKGPGDGEDKILQDTTLMADTDKGYGPSWAEAWSPASYADFHATGTRHMPKRNPFDLGPFEAEVLDDVAELVANGVAG